VKVLVSVVDDSGDEIRSLRNWLADEPPVRRHGHLRMGQAGSAAESMGTLDVVQVVVGSGLSLTQLLNLILTWRATRPQPVLVRVQVGQRTVEVRTADLGGVRRIVEELEASIPGTPEVS
jgi:hypothetical protein